MCTTNVVTACIFTKEFQAAGLFLALDSTSMRIPIPLPVEESTIKLVYNAIFICNESLFVVSAAATSAFQLKHTPRLLRSICPAGYQIRIIKNISHVALWELLLARILGM